jgi:hypothetical protein
LVKKLGFALKFLIVCEAYGLLGQQAMANTVNKVDYGNWVSNRLIFTFVLLGVAFLGWSIVSVVIHDSSCPLLGGCFVFCLCKAPVFA